MYKCTNRFNIVNT